MNEEELLPEAIFQELDLVLSSSYFSSSDRLKSFLSYIVNETLAGRSDRLKGYNIGIAVFDRDDDFDPQSDPAVRIVAGRLRSTLDRYYQDEGQNDPIRIRLPKGHNVPSFEAVSTKGEAGLNYGPFNEQLAGQPHVALKPMSIVILPFKSFSNNSDYKFLADGITEEIIVGFNRFHNFQVIHYQSALDEIGAQDDVFSMVSALGAGYLLSGGIRIDSNHLRITPQLLDVNTRTKVWAASYDYELYKSNILNLQTRIATKILAVIADNFGVICRAISKDSDNALVKNSNVLRAIVQFDNYLNSFTQEEFIATYDTLESVLAIEPNNSQLRAMLADLILDDYLHEFILAPYPLERALKEAQKAVTLDPICQYALFSMARVYFMKGDYATFLEFAPKIIKLNPASAYFVGNTGWHMAFSGEWAEGIALLNYAIELNTHHFPKWFNIALYFNHFRKKEYEAALSVIQMSNVPGEMREGVFKVAVLAELDRIVEAKEIANEVTKHEPHIVEKTIRYLQKHRLGEELFQRFIKALRKVGFSGSESSTDIHGAWLVDKWVPAFEHNFTAVQIEYIPLKKSSKKWRLCISLPLIKDPYWLAVAYGVTSQAKVLGIEVNIVEAGGYFNIEKQAEQITQGTQEGVDGLLIGAASFDAFENLLEEVSHKLPVFSFVNPVQSHAIKTQSAVDWSRMGAAIGEYLSAKHPEKTNKIKAIWLPGPKDLLWVQASDRAFMSAVRNSGVEIVATQYGDTDKDDQLIFIKNLLDKHLDIDCIVGVGVAIEAAIGELKRRGLTNRIKLYSDYLTPQVHRAILNGEVVAAATDFPILQARVAIDQAVRTLEGMNAHQDIGPSVFVIDSKNILNFPVEYALAPDNFTFEQIMGKSTPEHVFRFAVIDHPPYQIDIEDEITGIDIDLAKVILKRIGCQVIFVKCSLKRAIQDLEHGSVDIIGAMLSTSRTDDFAYRPMHHRSVMFSIFVVSKKMSQYSSLEDFFASGNRMALPQHTSYGSAIDYLIRRYSGSVVDCKNIEMGLKMLAKNHVEGIIIDPTVAKYHLDMLIPKDDSLSMVRAAPIYLGPPSKFCTLFSKRTVPSSVVARYNVELSLMQDRGEYEEIMQSYLS